MHIKQLKKLLCVVLSLTLVLVSNIVTISQEHQYSQNDNENYILIERATEEVERYDLGSFVYAGMVSEDELEKVNQYIDSIQQKGVTSDGTYSFSINDYNYLVDTPRETLNETNQAALSAGY